MSDPPAPKKIGSLRDRIAAFENKGGAPGPAPSPPVPRPKPGGLSWKPRPPSPPPTLPETTEDNAEKKAGGMSAADAKESIQKGQSLKERMAALQGRSGFATAAPAPPPPRPISEKPKWKPPPVVAAPAEEESDDAPKDQLQSPPVDGQYKPADPEATQEPADDTVTTGETEGGTREVDPEEEERQRRAAIAARMARLGGARVGMAPPIFGKKPDIPKKPEVLKAEEAEAPVSTDENSVAASGMRPPPCCHMQIY